jgi:hypothetical protein
MTKSKKPLKTDDAARLRRLLSGGAVHGLDLDAAFDFIARHLAEDATEVTGVRYEVAVELLKEHLVSGRLGLEITDDDRVRYIVARKQ